MIVYGYSDCFEGIGTPKAVCKYDSIDDFVASNYKMLIKEMEDIGDECLHLYQYDTDTCELIDKKFFRLDDLKRMQSE